MHHAPIRYGSASHFPQRILMEVTHMCVIGKVRTDAILHMPHQFLPPSFEAHLSGLPGFRAHVSYSISALVVKPTSDVSNIVKTTFFRKDDWYVGTSMRVHC